jgi:hypothetical protein
MTHTYKDASQFKQFTPEHDAVMTIYLEPVLNAWESYSNLGFKYSVKVPESFTFVEFKSGWDQDDFIHNNSAHKIATDLGFVPDVDVCSGQDYPRYSEKNCQDSLRFFFKNANDAWMFAAQIEATMDCIADNKLSALY